MDYFIGEIRLFPYNRIPSSDGWVPCSGQVMQISSYQALFSLLRTYYGGDGRVTFNLPNLNGRAIVGYSPTSTTYQLGSSGGSEGVILAMKNIPIHNHNVEVMNSYDAMLPAADFIGNPNVKTASGQIATNVGNSLLYTDTSSSPTLLNSESVSTTGGNGVHENRMPFLAMVYCISTVGFYPPRQD
jgi:microcystin-dependent protein